MASRKAKSGGKQKKRAQRATSNVFAMFDQAQIQEFKEAFTLIDQNRDGFIDREDLHDMFASMGKDPENKVLDEMVGEAPGPINFTMFLTLFGEKLNGTDPEETIKNAFKTLDDNGSGLINEDDLVDALCMRGDRLTKDEFEQMCYGAPIDDRGDLDYIAFCRIIKHGTKDEELVKKSG
ncbi:myosin regulatory light chain 12B-like [Saccoglossus kowalevskii]|uniref:Myosin regulatory light chain 2, smooth muscle major isoform-like n=1 Tax=Saccoglossus kowalevskii TaxID=10224 RepID=A0ABM0H1J7_SACKO|nr:PREDICTED: myosin regulatory light chain 2, smooth muscle major isoform-like [Saccoglossus kowalevskii]